MSNLDDIENLTILDRQPNPVINQILFHMRHIEWQKDRRAFRHNLRDLGFIMGYELAKGMQTEEVVVPTPLGQATQRLLEKHPVVIGILRASIPMWLGVLDVFTGSEAGIVAISRNEATFDSATGHLDVQMGYISLPAIDNADVVIVDPMIAAGNSIIALLDILTHRGHNGETMILGAIASPIGLRRIQKVFSKVQFMVASLDKDLNSAAYIVPGLGDAGDLAFGTPIYR